MKKILLPLIVIALLLQQNANGQYITVNSTFGNWLINHAGCGSCMIGTTQLDTTCAVLPTVTSINCSGYNIPNLEGIQYFINLTSLSCFSCNLTTIPAFPPNLTGMDIYNNLLTTIPPLPQGLTVLSADNNLLQSIPPIPITLTQLLVGNNQLTALPPLPDSLDICWIFNNPGLHCMPPIQKINTLYIYGTAIQCLPNQMIINTSNPLMVDTLPICNIMNANACDYVADIAGHVTYDDDNDCATPIGTPSLVGVTVDLYDYSLNFIQSVNTTSSGAFTFDNGIGNYIARVDTSFLPFNVHCPSSNMDTSSLSVIDSTNYFSDFSVVCKPGYDVGTVAVERTAGLFRPNTNATVHFKSGFVSLFSGVDCSVAGLSGTVTVNFTGPVTYVGPASGSIVPGSVTGNQIIWNVSDFLTLNTPNALAVIMHTDIGAAIGSQVCFQVIVDASTGTDNNLSNNVYDHCFTVVNSIDPNTKEVSPISFEQTPEWLTYTVNFQNTGSAPAINIIVKDTLDSNLQWSTLKVISASDANITQVLQDGTVKFNFPNINLPDSLSDEPGSHGFIQYVIKTKNNLTNPTLIHNSASIYFDFNSPIVTNDAISTYSFSGVENYLSVSGKFVLFPNPADQTILISLHSLSKNSRLVVCDVAGKEICSMAVISSNFKFETLNLQNGIYFITVTSPTQAVTQKLIVQH